MRVGHADAAFFSYSGRYCGGEGGTAGAAPDYGEGDTCASIDTVTTHAGGVVPVSRDVETAAVDTSTATTAVHATPVRLPALPPADMARP